MGDHEICPKCRGVMVRGFVADFSYQQPFGVGPAVMVSRWVEGAPRKSKWRVTQFPADKAVPTATFRCEGCGFLESYARPEFAAE